MKIRQLRPPGAIRLLLLFSLLLAGLATSLLVPLPIPVHAATCSVPSGLYPEIQTAVDDPECDTITLGAGLFEEQVRIQRSLTLQGAGRTATIINGQGEGRPITISGATTVVQISALRLTNGVALPSPRAGGGLLVQNGATLHATELQIDNNAASAETITSGRGGGLAVLDAAAYLTSTLVFSNTALLSGKGNGYGGGIYVAGGDVAGAGRATFSLTNSQIRGNVAYDSNVADDATGRDAAGGGLYVRPGSNTRITLRGNTWDGNVARFTDAFPDAGDGGAIALETPGSRINLIIEGDTFRNNIANSSLNTSVTHTARGGALFFQSEAANGVVATLADLTFEGNIARNAVVGEAVGQGGALYANNSEITFEDGDLIGNRASTGLDGNPSAHGGALYLVSTTMTGERLIIRENSALAGNGSTAEGADSRGGGIALDGTASLVLANSIIADNSAAATNGNGAAVYVGASAQARMTHVTIAAAELNPQAGMYAAATGKSGDVRLTNSIVVSHTTGIVNQGVTGRVTLDRVLFFGNGTDTAGSLAVQAQSITADPGFVDPTAGNYLIGPASGAINTGINTTVTTDINGDSRPLNGRFDIGADEYPEPLPVLTATIGGPTLGPPGSYAFAGGFGPQFATTPISYTWDNGDTTPFSIRTFEEPGDYTISLTVTNNDGSDSATVTHTIRINPAPPVTQCPTALTSATLTGPNAGEAGDSQTFAATFAPANASSPVDYNWSPAPEGDDNAADATFIWGAGGEFPVAVTIQNCRSAVAAARTINITLPAEPDPAPELDEFIYLPLLLR